MEVCKFRFFYGKFGDSAELMVTRPSFWNDQVIVTSVLVALPGTWRQLGGPPGAELSEAMVRAAEEVSGLKLEFRPIPWKLADHRAVMREVTMVGDNTRRILELFPATAQA